MVQRAHNILEKSDGVYVVSFFIKWGFYPGGLSHCSVQSLVITDEPCTSDKDTTNERCGKQFRMHGFTPVCEGI
jgi:hypothetical protein